MHHLAYCASCRVPVHDNSMPGPCIRPPLALSRDSQGGYVSFHGYCNVEVYCWKGPQIMTVEKGALLLRAYVHW